MSEAGYHPADNLTAQIELLAEFLARVVKQPRDSSSTIVRMNAHIDAVIMTAVWVVVGEPSAVDRVVERVMLESVEVNVG